MIRRASLAFLVAAGACDKADSGDEDEGGSSEDTSVPDVDFETMVQPIFNANCTCHLQGMSGTMTAPTLTLNPGISYGQLVGTPSTAVPGLARIEPGMPDASYLWHKISGTQLEVGGGGDMMPPPPLPFADADKQTIEDWILGGAMP